MYVSMYINEYILVFFNNSLAVVYFCLDFNINIKLPIFTISLFIFFTGIEHTNVKRLLI